MGIRGQVNIFVIVAVIIAALGILAYAFYPQILSTFSGDLVPSNYLRNCIEENVEQNVALISSQGGYANPEGYLLHEGNRLKYLCYTSRYYQPCVVQESSLVEQFSMELENAVKPKVQECFDNMKNEYEARGFDVRVSRDPVIDVSVRPEDILVVVDGEISVTKENTQTLNDFDVSIRSNMYELLLVATSIVDYESSYGDSEITLYTSHYPNLYIEKKKLGDGSKVYNLEDVTTQERFSFASRGLSWPAGYGIE